VIANLSATASAQAFAGGEPRLLAKTIVERIDTRSYRHCHNRPPKVYCYTREPGDVESEHPQRTRTTHRHARRSWFGHRHVHHKWYEEF
jgi:hypothetical protein